MSQQTDNWLNVALDDWPTLIDDMFPTLEDLTTVPATVTVELPADVILTLNDIAQRHGETPALLASRLVEKWARGVQANERRQWQRLAKRAGLRTG